MLSWLKKVLGLRKSRNKHSSKDSTICKNSDREEIVEWVDQGLHDFLVQENDRKIDNGYPVFLLPLSTPSPSPPSPAPPLVRFSPPRPFPPPHSPSTSPPPQLIRNSPLKQSPPPPPPPPVAAAAASSPPPPLIRNSPLKKSPPPPASPPPSPLIRNCPPKQSPLPHPSLPPIPNSPPLHPPRPTPPLFQYSPNATHTEQNASLSVGQSLKVKTLSTDLPHASPEPQPSSQGKRPSPLSNTQTRPLSGTQATSRAPNTESPLEVSQDRDLSFSKASISKDTQHGILPSMVFYPTRYPAWYFVCEEVKVSQTDRQVEGGEVIGPKVHQKSYPSCLLATTLTNHIGELVTVKGTRYVRIKNKEEVLMVPLNTGPKGEAPCRLVWQSGRPVPLVELCDSTCVNIDAFLSPGSERMQAMVVWQQKKPNTCLQLLDNTYIFLDSRTLTCQQKSLNISAKRLNITFDRKQVSAEVSNAVAFQENKVISMIKFLQFCPDEFYATVFKMLEGTGHGRVVYVCTCLWIGRRPTIDHLPMLVKKQNLYKKISYGLYSPSDNMRILYCDVNASLCLIKGAATIKVEVDGSLKSLEATHLLNLELDKLKQHAPVRVSAHVMKEVCGGREKWSAVMIYLPNSTGTDTSPTWVAAGHNAPNTNEGCALQNTSGSPPQKDNVTSREGASISPIQGTSILAALNTSVPAEHKVSVQSLSKPTIPTGKTQLKSASLSQLSFSTNAQEENAWSSVLKSKYLTCSVMASKPNAAVVVGNGKIILVLRSNLFINQVQLPSSANVEALLKKYKNLGVIFTESREEFTKLDITMKHVALVAWAGKKPLNADAIAQQRLSAMKAAPVPNRSPTPRAVLHAALKVEASCWIKTVQNKRVTLLVRSKHLPKSCGIALTKLGNMYQDGTPITLASAMKSKGQFWHCELRIEDGGKQLTVPLAWRGKKPATDALPGTSTSQPRQALSTGDLSDIPNRHLLTPPLSSCKVIMGEVAEVLPEGGRVKVEDGRHFTFSIDACFLYDLCLQQIRAREVLVVGMKVEIEVTCSGGSETVRRVWLAGRGAAPTLSSFLQPKLDSWCSVNGVSPATQRSLMKEAELLSPTLFPTAASAEATTIVDITA